MLQVRGRNNSMALTAGDGYSRIVTTSMDAPLDGVTPVTGRLQLAYGENIISDLGANATAGKW